MISSLKVLIAEKFDRFVPIPRSDLSSSIQLGALIEKATEIESPLRQLDRGLPF